MSNAATTVKATCGKCNGKGRLSWTSIANGVCFVCDGSGHLLADESSVKAARSPRTTVIAVIKSNLDSMARNLEIYGDAFAFSDESYAIGWALAHADSDVRARAVAALIRLGAGEVQLSNIARIEADETSKLVAGARKVTRNVRKA